jgi:outer membrane lipoprotein SlyB
MNKHWFFLRTIFCALPFLAASVAQAQAPGKTPRISGFDLEQVQQLTPGTELRFLLYGTAGGTATLQVGGAQRRLVLEEVQAGSYEGTHTISMADKIAPDSKVTANLRVGNQVSTAVLNETVLTAAAHQAAVAASQAASPAAALRINRFDVTPAADLTAGRDLQFSVTGTAGAQATVVIDGAKGKVLLEETKPGYYSGAYTVRTGDRVVAGSNATAQLRSGERQVSMVLGKSLTTGAAVEVATPAICPHCGTVEAVNEVEVKGEGGYLGAVAGGVIGAVLGNQVGGGDGRKVARVVGAVGGALAGREVEKNLKKTKHYEVVVRLQSGATQTVSHESDPGFKVGQKVKVVDGALVRDE